VFRNAFLRKILDLQYRSLCQAENKLLKNLDFASLRVLDHGAGEQEFKKRHRCAHYFSLDPFCPATWKSTKEIPPNENFDLIVSSEVFEHLENPAEVLKALCAHQRPGQKIFITTPFMARQHGAPRDYQRWTQVGLESLLTKAGYRVERSVKRGNLISVISAFLNFKLFQGLRSIYFPIALFCAPVVLAILALAHISLKCGAHSDTYLGLSVLASKVD
jgi:hypothetical protein